jgi:hypothetical protein
VRTLAELIDHEEPGWPVVEEWLAAARNPVEVLPVEASRAACVLTLVQVTTRSPLGAIAYHSGGLLVDGWLRILGGGGPRMRSDLACWNGLGDNPLFGGIDGAFVVALDVMGGVFAMFGATRTLSYFAPDTLAWQELDVGYSSFVSSMLQTNLEEFFSGLRWPGWRDEVEFLELDQGIQVVPPLWTAESGALPPKRFKVPLRELVDFGFDAAKQLCR